MATVGVSKLKKIGKKIEHAARRVFISSLQCRSGNHVLVTKTSEVLQLPANPTILFLRQDRLGDAIISTPVFTELYNKYPAGKFIVLLGENNKGIRDLLPIPCEVEVYRKKPLADMMMLRRLRKKKIDVLIDLIDNPSSTSSILTAAISAKYSVGIEKANASSYAITVPLIDRAKYHIARRIAELLRPFGIDPEHISLRPQLKDLTVKKIQGKAGIVISAGAPDRYIPVKINAEIAEAIIERGFASEVAIYFHPKDRKLAEEIINRTKNQHITLAQPSAVFSEYAKGIVSCEFIVSPDTSAIHLCSAYGIPVMGIYAPFPPELHYWTPIGVPYEMIVQYPDLGSLETSNVIHHIEKLLQTVTPKVQEAVFSE